MTFVDEGKLALDDPVARYLPGFDGAKAGITVRQLLSHRTGLPSAACEGDPSTTLARCVRAIAARRRPRRPRPAPSSTTSGVGFVIAGRLIERLSGTSFEAGVRVAHRPAARHDRTPASTARSRPHNRNPAPAASARSTVADYARFLAMLAHDGTVDGHTVLQPASVAEIERDQVAGLDTSDDGAVADHRDPDLRARRVARRRRAPTTRSRWSAAAARSASTRGSTACTARTGSSRSTTSSTAPSTRCPASQRIARMLWEAAA